MFNRRAHAIRERWPAVMSEEFCSAGGVDSWFAQQWTADKQFVIPELTVTHIPHTANHGDSWNGSRHGWRQCGMLTPTGYIPTEDVPEAANRFRLTDTKEGRTVETTMYGNQFPPAAVQTTGADLLLAGKSTQGCHVAVAYWKDK
jgi:hypothetical protein